MSNELKEKYYVKRGNEEYTDITEKFDGLRILKVDGFFSRGEPVNIYNEQWVNEQSEDFMITTLDEDQNPKVIYKNTDIKITFIVGNKYATNTIDVGRQHDAFIDYMTNGALYVKSYYANKETYCVCVSNYEPQTIKLQRDDRTYMVGELTLHQLDLPQEIQIVYLGDLYIGTNGSIISNVSELQNSVHYNVQSPVGTYSYAISNTSYLWLCTTGTINGVTSSGYQVPISLVTTIGSLKCYRTSNQILPHTMSFTIN